MAEQRINVIGPDGQIGTVPISSALPEGWKLEQPEETERRVLEAEYGTGVGQVAAAGAGLVRGLTAGASDVALTRPLTGYVHPLRKIIPSLKETPLPIDLPGVAALGARLFGEEKEEEGVWKTVRETKGPIEPKELAALKKINPAITTAAEVTGAVLPAVATGGKSLLARGAAKTGAGLITAAGKAAERGVGLALGEQVAPTLIRQIGREALKKGVGSAVEGAFMAYGQIQSDDALSQKESAPEAIAAKVGLGALIGFGIGAPIGGGAVAGKALLAKAAEVAGQTFAEGGIGAYAREKAVQGLFAVPSKIKKLRAKGRIQQIGDDLLKPSKYLDDAAPIQAGSVASTAERIKKVIKNAGQHKGELIKQIDDLAKGLTQRTPEGTAILKAGKKVPVGVDPQKIANRIEKELADEIAGNPGLQKEYRQLLKMADSWRKHKNIMSFVTADKYKIQIQRKYQAIFKQLSPSFGNKLKARSEGILNSEIDKRIQEVAKQAGVPQVAADFLESKRLLSNMYQAKELVESGLERIADNRAISLTDYLSGGAVGAGAAATLGPLGFAAGPAAAVSNKILREHGNIWASKVADKIAKLSWVERTTAAYSDQLGKALDDYITGDITRRVVVPSAVEVLDGLRISDPLVSDKAVAKDKPTRIIENIHQMAANPVELSERVAHKLSALEPHAPTIAAELATQAVADVQYLASKAPQPPQFVGLTPHLQQWKATKSDVLGFKRIIQVLNDPEHIITALQTGDITPDMVEALKTRRPQIYKQIQTHITQRASELKSELPYRKRVNLSALFEVPLDSSMVPQNVKQIQTWYSITGPSPSPPKRPGVDSKMAQNLQTENEKLAQ
jgi:hypothetical protein